jgi:hypothetical protein
MSGRIVMTTPEHEVVYQELIALVNRHAADLTALEILAIAGNLVGKLIALQDQRITSSTVALETVIQNLEQGNRQALDALEQTKGSA